MRMAVGQRVALVVRVFATANLRLEKLAYVVCRRVAALGRVESTFPGDGSKGEGGVWKGEGMR
jgi:hypothetical protein